MIVVGSRPAVRVCAQSAPQMGGVKLDGGKNQKTCVMPGQKTVMAILGGKFHVVRTQTVIYGKFVCIFTKVKRISSTGKTKRVFVWIQYASIV